MKRSIGLRFAQAAVVALVAALALIALASLGASASPASTSAPAATEQYPKKVLICHRTRSKKNPYRTIRVSRNAVKAHLRHGDGIGRCNSAIFTICHKSKKAKKAKKRTMKVRGAKAHRKHLKHGDKIRACPKKKKKKR